MGATRSRAHRRTRLSGLQSLDSSRMARSRSNGYRVARLHHRGFQGCLSEDPLAAAQTQVLCSVLREPTFNFESCTQELEAVKKTRRVFDVLVPGGCKL